MGSRLPRVLLACLIGAAAATNVEAALVSWGAQAGTSVANCPSFCTSFNFGPTVGGMNFFDSGLSSVVEPRGNADARATLSGGFSTPVLKARSAADAGFRGAFGTAFAVQGYTYNGAGETLTLDVDLDGLVTDPESDASDTSAELEVVLYASNPFDFISDRGTLDFELGATPLEHSGGGPAAITLQLDFSNPSHAQGQISIDVNPGDEFYLWAFLRAESQSGAAATSVEAFNTGTMNFLGNPNLVAASVPVPAALWLFGSGVVAMCSLRRRRDPV